MTNVPTFCWSVVCCCLFPLFLPAVSANEPRGFRQLIRLPVDHQPPRNINPVRQSAIHDVAFSPDGRSLAAASGDNCVQLFDVPGGRRKLVFKDRKYPFHCVAFSPDGKLLAYGGMGATICSLPVEDTNSWSVQASWVNSIAFSPDGTKLAVGNYRDRFALFDTRLRRRLARFDPFAGMGQIDTGLYNPGVHSLAFSPDGKLLAACIELFDDELPLLQRIQIWSLRTGKLLTVFDGQFGHFTADGSALVTGHKGKIELRDVETFAVSGRFGIAARLIPGDLSPDGKVVAVIANGQTVQLWDWASQQLMHVLKGHGQRINSIDFSADGKLLAAGCADGSIQLWTSNAPSASE